MDDPELKEVMKIVERVLILRAEQAYLQRALSKRQLNINLDLGDEQDTQCRSDLNPKKDRKKILLKLQEKKKKILKQLKDLKEI